MCKNSKYVFLYIQQKPWTFLSILPFGHLSEANIRGGGKTVHVVFKYLSSKATPSTLRPSLSVDFSLKDDRTVIFFLSVSSRYFLSEKGGGGDKAVQLKISL
jgi:hypothetical protein